MSDFTWYSRLLIWLGALILLVESVTNHIQALATIVAVVFLCAGLLGFVGGLTFEGSGLVLTPSSPPPTTSAEPPPRAQFDGISAAPPVIAVAPPQEQFEQPPEPPPVKVSAPAPVEKSPVVETQIPSAMASPPPRPRGARGAVSIDLTEDSP